MAGQGVNPSRGIISPALTSNRKLQSINQALHRLNPSCLPDLSIANAASSCGNASPKPNYKALAHPPPIMLKSLQNRPDSSKSHASSNPNTPSPLQRKACSHLPEVSFPAKRRAPKAKSLPNTSPPSPRTPLLTKPPGQTTNS